MLNELLLVLSEQDIWLMWGWVVKESAMLCLLPPSQPLDLSHLYCHFVHEQLTTCMHACMHALGTSCDKRLQRFCSGDVARRAFELARKTTQGFGFVWFFWLEPGQQLPLDMCWTAVLSFLLTCRSYNYLFNLIVTCYYHIFQSIIRLVYCNKLWDKKDFCFVY